jgi:hypothetical protein
MLRSPFGVDCVVLILIAGSLWSIARSIFSGGVSWPKSLFDASSFHVPLKSGLPAAQAATIAASTPNTILRFMSFESFRCLVAQALGLR